MISKRKPCHLFLKKNMQSWISDATWRFFDQLNVLRRLPKISNQTIHHCLYQSLKASFQDNRKQKVAATGVIAEGGLSEGNTKEA